MNRDEREDLERLLRRAAAIDDEDEDADDAYWEVVSDLHRRNDRDTFELMCGFARSPSADERRVAIDVLGQIGYSADRPFLVDTLPVVIRACDDDDVPVVDAAVTALGFFGDDRGLAAVLRHVEHRSDEIRHSVARALPSVAGSPPADVAISALIRLTADPDGEIRDWATFGLGCQLDADTWAVREALVARLNDTEGDTAGEALVGLARRLDPRTLLPLLARLEDSPDNLVVEAAGALGAPEALPPLLRLQASGWEDYEGPRPANLGEAILSCSHRRRRPH